VRFARDDFSVFTATLEEVIRSDGAPLPVEEGRVFAVAGPLPRIFPDDLVSVAGHWDQHPRYGWQFRATVGQRTIGADIESLVAYLSRLPQVGRFRARKIADLGEHDREEVIRIITEEPERLVEVKGITASRAAKIQEELIKNGAMRDTLFWLADLGLSERLITKLIKMYSTQLKEALLANPYLLIPHVGFKKADSYALSKFGVAPRAPLRLAYVAAHFLTGEEDEGHTYSLLSELT
jgi:exodeoxyribonuclease V alpha subunit